MDERAHYDRSGRELFVQVPASRSLSVVRAGCGGRISESVCVVHKSTHCDEIAAGKSVVGILLQIVKGSVLQIRLNDPNNLSAAANGKLQPDLLIGARTSIGMFEPTIARLKDSTGTIHEVTIPF